MSLPEHGDVVAQVHRAWPPARTGEGALAFVLAVIRELQRACPQERVGLLIKTAGENIVPYHTASGLVVHVSASRIVYPDHNLLVKVLTDVPTTNGPSWQPEIGIPNGGHHGGYLAVDAVPPVSPPPAAVDHAKQIAGLQADLVQVWAEIWKLHAFDTIADPQLYKIAGLDTRIHALEERATPAAPPVVVKKPSWWPW
jgi:hypothetical protein